MMFRIKFLFVFVILITSAKANYLNFLSNNRLSPIGRIVGGEPAAIIDHPWQVSLQTLGFHYCGGTIITKNHVLTANHCAKSFPTKWISVRVGTSIIMEDGQVHRVNETISHENYMVNEHNVPINDIAILILRTSIVFNVNVKPIKLFEQDEVAKDGTMSTISGWGAVKEGGSLSFVLRAVDVPIVNKNACSKAYASYGGIPDGQICAAYPDGGKDTCQGDSGGPLVIEGRQAGIVSWGNGCARRGYPGVYTEIAAFRNWITEHVGI